MRKSTRLQLVVIMLGLMIFLSSCSNAASVYEAPIGSGEGIAWFQWIVEQIADFTYWVSMQAGGAYVVGLIIVTLIVRTIGWPIYAKTNATTLKMQQAQPELEKINEKYLGKNDEQAQRAKQAEIFAVYKKYKINVLGCLLPFAQMPIFISMYQVVRRIPISFTDGGMYPGLKIDFLWFTFGQPDKFYILPILVGLLMFGYQKYSMKKPAYLENKKYKTSQAKQSENTMKIMMYFMVFMLVSISMSDSAIAFYWIIGNSYQFLQTYLNRRSNAKKMAESRSII